MFVRSKIVLAIAVCLMATASTAHESHHHNGQSKSKKERSMAGSELVISGEWIRSTAPGTPTTAAYFLLKNDSNKDITLLNAKSDIAERVEIHEHTMQNGVMKMQKTNGVLIPKQSNLVFEPGGYHVMFIGLKDSVDTGEKVDITLEFDNGTTQDIRVVAKKKAGNKHGKHHGEH